VEVKPNHAPVPVKLEYSPMVGEVRLPQAVWEHLRATLLADLTRETKCFLLCRTLESGARVVFLAREVVPVPDEAYAQRSASLVETRPEFVHALLTRCAREGYALLDAHTHPWTTQPRFSAIDDRSDLQKFQTTQSMSPPFRHGSLVFGCDMSFEGRFWDYTREAMATITRLQVLETPPRTHYGTDCQPPDWASAAQAVYDRQVRAFGLEGQAMLGRLRVAVVGAGGLGSQIANALALLGVGHLLLIDPDRLELSNLNRVVGASYAQAARGWRKVRALAQRLNRARPPERRTVVPLPLDARTRDALAHLLSCDLIVGAVDSAVVRQYLNTVAMCALDSLPRRGRRRPQRERTPRARRRTGAGHHPWRDRVPRLHRARHPPKRGGATHAPPARTLHSRGLHSGRSDTQPAGGVPQRRRREPAGVGTGKISDALRACPAVPVLRPAGAACVSRARRAQPELPALRGAPRQPAWGRGCTG
jgi:hypothetical protein